MALTQLHLSPTGSDRGDGSARRPFATPKRAQVAARKAAGTVQIVVHDGTYELAETLVFTPADSGQRLSAAAGARPVFSGGRRLAGWQVGMHAGRAAWTLDLPAVADGLWNFTQLWVDGRRRQRPTLPKQGFFRFSGLDGQSDTGFAWGKGPDRAEYPANSLARFRNLDDVSLVAYQLWFDTHHRIKTLDEERRLVGFHVPSLGSLRDEGGQFARFRLINVGEALGDPGEWYLDRSSGRLTYLPMDGESTTGVTVVAPRLAEIVRFQGSAREAVTDVVIENLSLQHNEWTRGIDTCGTVQAAYDVPGAVILERAERCVLYGCELAHCASYGVEMLAGCNGNIVAACSIHDLGGGAVKIGHENLRVHEAGVGKEFAGDPRWLRPMAATVADCHLFDGGHIYPSAIGVWIGNAGANRIQHNHIHHFAYTGISLGWSWGYAATRTWDNRIEWNHIHHINHERLLSDNGGIYSLGVQPGSTVIGNHIHDIACYHYGGWGLYPDEGSSGMTWSRNCVHRVQYCGFSVHYGRFLTVENNIFATMDKAMLNPGRADLSCGLVFARNLTWFDQDNLKPDADWTPSLCATSRNLVWNAGTGKVAWHLGSLSAEQAAGRWLGSVETDPLFADPLSGDFTLRADSPAFALGFKPVDWRKAGVRPRARLPTTWKAYRLPAAKPRALAVARLTQGELRLAGTMAELPIQVELSNPSAKRVRGVWRLVCPEGGAVTILPSPRITADLAPGQIIVREFVVHLQPTQGRRWLQALGDDRTSFSAATPVCVPFAVTMPRHPAGAPASGGLDISVVHATQTILSGSAVIAGPDLVISCTIRDHAIRVDRANPYAGASVELFVGVEPKTGEPHRLRQLFVIPPDASGPGELRAVGFPAAEASWWRISVAPGGWQADLRLPLAWLGLDEDATRFRFDLICNAASPVAGQNFLKLPRWGSLGNWSNILGLAQVTVKA